MVVHLYCSGGCYFEECVKFVARLIIAAYRAKYCVTILKEKDARDGDGDSEKSVFIIHFEEEAKVEVEVEVEVEEEMKETKRKMKKKECASIHIKREEECTFVDI